MMDVISPIFSQDDLAQMPKDGKRYEVLEEDLPLSPSSNRKIGPPYYDEPSRRFSGGGIV